jgi:hypothetical protein
MASVVWRAINRSDASAWELSWPFLAYIEHICDLPTHSLTHIDWDCILLSDGVFLVHLHHLAILRHKVAHRSASPTFYYWRLLPPRRLGGVSIELSVKIVEKPWWWLWGVRAYLAVAAKATLVESRYWAISCPLAQRSSRVLIEEQVWTWFTSPRC